MKRQLRWFGHVARSQDMINASYKLNFTNPKPRGHPLKRWSGGIRENSGVPLLTMERRVADRKAYTNQVYNVHCTCVLQRYAKSYATKSYIKNGGIYQIHGEHSGKGESYQHILITARKVGNKPV